MNDGWLVTVDCWRVMGDGWRLTVDGWRLTVVDGRRWWGWWWWCWWIWMNSEVDLDHCCWKVGQLTVRVKGVNQIHTRRLKMNSIDLKLTWNWIWSDRIGLEQDSFFVSWFISSLMEWNCNRMMNCYCYWWLRHVTTTTVVALFVSVILLNTLTMNRMICLWLIQESKQWWIW